MKNKNLLIIGAVVVVLLLGIGGYLAFGHKSGTATDDSDVASLDEDVIKLSPSDVGLTLTATANQKQVKFALSKATGITNIEYELSYEADSAGKSDEGESGRITRGVAGEDTIDSDQSTYESKLLDLGSCSSGTCRYDVGVTSVKILLKLTKTDGKVYQVEQTLDLK